MTIIKSFSVGNGDTFYIKHSSDNFTVIDCNIPDDDPNDIIEEIKSESKGKGIVRFISTHPDEDHFHGLSRLDDKMNFLNFYCVKNEAIKEDVTEDFQRYCDLRDSEKKAFSLYKGCKRKWMNQTDDERGSAGINIKWPDRDNKYFKEALENAKNGESPNNISPIITYSMNEGASFVWMGDLESEFMENISDVLDVPEAAILFAPHHGRDSGKVPEAILDQLNPQIVIIGEAPSKELNYYKDYNTITQNSADDIIFECDTGKVHIYVSNDNYSVNFLKDEQCTSFNNYIGTLIL